MEPFTKLTINVALKSKRNAFHLATKRVISIGRLFETLIDREIADELNGKRRRQRQ